MATEESRAVVQSWIDCTARGDIDAALALFDENAVWTNIGSTRFSGEFTGLANITRELIGPLFGELEGGIASEIEVLLADGDRAVLLSRGRARTRSGRDYNNTYAQVFTVKDGRITAVREYMDTALVDSVFGPAG